MTTEYKPSTKQLNALISLAENNADMTQVRNSAFYKTALTAESVHIDHTGIQAKLSPKVLSLITQIVSESKTIKDLSIKYNGSTVPISAAVDASTKSVDASIKPAVTQDANVQNNGSWSWKGWFGGNKTTKTSSIQNKSVDEKTPAATKAPTTDAVKKDNTQVKASDKPVPATTEASKKSDAIKKEQVKSVDKHVSEATKTSTKSDTAQKGNVQDKNVGKHTSAKVESSTKSDTVQKENTSVKALDKHASGTVETSAQSNTTQEDNVQGNNLEDEYVQATIDTYANHNMRHNHDHFHVRSYTTYYPTTIIVMSNGNSYIGYTPKTTLRVEVHMTGEDSYNPEGW